MKIIVFGLGNFGMSLAISLTETGNEVIGVDKQMDKVNLIKDKISHAICMDSTNELAYTALPLLLALRPTITIILTRFLTLFSGTLLSNKPSMV